jgi:hypothetical protein
MARFASGSNRAAEMWKKNYRILGAQGICLHQLCLTMDWLRAEIGQRLINAPLSTQGLG